MNAVRRRTAATGRSPRRSRAAVLVALTGVLALLTTSCSGAASGWTEVQEGHLSVERPDGWTEQDPSGELWTKRFTGDAMELQVSGDFSEDPTASAAFSRLDLPATVGLDGYQGGAVERAEVPGADTAVRSDFTYTDDGTTKRGIWIIAGQYPYPSTAAITITGETLDEELVAHVLDSLAFAKTSGK